MGLSSKRRGGSCEDGAGLALAWGSGPARDPGPAEPRPAETRAGTRAAAGGIPPAARSRPHRPGAAHLSLPTPSASRSLTEVVHGGAAGAGSRLGVALAARPGAAPHRRATFPPRASARNGTRRRRARPRPPRVPPPAPPASTRAPPPPRAPPVVAPARLLVPPREHAGPAPAAGPRERAQPGRWAPLGEAATPPCGRAGRWDAPRPSGPLSVFLCLRVTCLTG